MRYVNDVHNIAVQTCVFVRPSWIIVIILKHNFKKLTQHCNFKHSDEKPARAHFQRSNRNLIIWNQQSRTMRRGSWKTEVWSQFKGGPESSQHVQNNSDVYWSRWQSHVQKPASSWQTEHGSSGCAGTASHTNDMHTDWLPEAQTTAIFKSWDQMISACGWWRHKNPLDLFLQFTHRLSLPSHFTSIHFNRCGILKSSL